MANANLVYGNGDCAVEGTNIVSVQIHYEGSIDVLDKTPDGFQLFHNNKAKIVLIFLLPGAENVLGELFEYTGDFKIISTIIVNNIPKIIPSSIKKMVDYSELINTNSEDMTINVDDLKGGHYSKKRLGPKPLKQRFVMNLDTAAAGGQGYFLEDGTEYNGLYHIHLQGVRVMTGGVHTEESQPLYFMDRVSKKLIIANHAGMTNNGAFIRKARHNIRTAKKRGTPSHKAKQFTNPTKL